MNPEQHYVVPRTDELAEFIFAPRQTGKTTFFYAREEIENLYHKRGEVPSEALSHFLENMALTDNVSMLRGFGALARVLENQRVVVFIDEFDGVLPTVVNDFLYALRRIYISRTAP